MLTLFAEGHLFPTIFLSWWTCSISRTLQSIRAFISAPCVRLRLSDSAIIEGRRTRNDRHESMQGVTSTASVRSSCTYRGCTNLLPFSACESQIVLGLFEHVAPEVDLSVEVTLAPNHANASQCVTGNKKIKR